jgi:probable phosphoglycerate mutase
MSGRDSFHQTLYEVPAGATEVLVVRHGASEPAVSGVPFPLLDGHSDPGLSEVGLAQAELVANALRDEKLDGLFTSPLRRTRLTAGALAAAMAAEPTVIYDLREILLGDFEGGEFRVRQGRGDPIISQVFAEERWDLIPNAELAESFSERVRRGFEQVVAAVGPDARAAVVVHGGVIGEVCRMATKSRPFAFLHADNCSITRIVVNSNGSWLLRSFNEISHLVTGDTQATATQ